MNDTTDADGNVQRWVITQDLANELLRPEFIGDELQLFLGGLFLAVALMSPVWSWASRRLRAFLVVIVLLNLIYTALRSALLTTRSTAQYRDLDWLNNVTIAEVLVVWVYIIITTSVQIFLAIRVVSFLRSRLARYSWLLVFVLALTVTLFGWVTVIWVQTSRFGGGEPDSFLANYGALFYYFGAAFVDILITATLVHSLANGIAGFSTRTESMYHRLVRTTLSTGMPTAATALVTAILETVWDATSYDGGKTWVTPALSFPLPSLYCLSVLWTLGLLSKIPHDRKVSDIEVSLGVPRTAPSGESSDAAQPERPRGRPFVETISLGRPMREIRTVRIVAADGEKPVDTSSPKVESEGSSTSSDK